MTLYKTKDVLYVTGISRGQFDQWIQKKILVAEKPARRQGSAAGFSLHNIVQVVLIDKLSQAGLNLRVASEIASEAVNNVIIEGELEGEDIVLIINFENIEDREYLPADQVKPAYFSELTLLIRLDPIYNRVELKLEEL